MHSISGGSMDDIKVLTELNEQFIEAFRRGSWELLSPILSPDFAYLDGATGETWSEERYIENLRNNPSPSLVIDQLAVHADGDTAVVSARTCREPGRYRRSADTYARRNDGWVCVHACVLTVCSEMTNSRAISAFESPRATRRNTSSSRAVRSSNAGGGFRDDVAAKRSIRRRVTAGAKSEPPAATMRMPARSCSSGASLSKKPLAPARSAS